MTVIKYIYRGLFSVICFSVLLGCVTEKGVVTDPEEAMSLKQYAVASTLYENLYKKASRNEKGTYAYRTAFSAESAYKYDRAITWYKKAVEHDFGLPAYKQYADMLRYLESYDQAYRLYELLFKQTNDSKYRELMSACQQSMRWQKQVQKLKYSLDPLAVNSEASEYALVPVGSGYYFSSDRAAHPEAKSYNWTGNYYSDIYTYEPSRQNGIERVGAINTEQNEGTLAVHSNGEEIIFSRCYAESGDAYCSLYRSVKKGKKWTAGERLSFQKAGVNYTSPTFYRGDSALIYAAEDPKGIGGYDLFIIYRDRNGWGEPYILDQKINTSSNESFPTTYKDTIYFSSDRIGGMGGLDIYKTYPDGAGSWVRSENVKPPINSGGDDLHLFRQSDRSFFISSNRQGGKGGDDIYHLVYEQSSIPGDGVDETPEEEEQTIYYLGGIIQSIVRENIEDPYSTVLGKRPLSNASILITYGDTSLTLNTDASGRYLVPVDPVTVYNAKAQAKDHLTNNKTLNILEHDTSEDIVTYNLNVDLEPIVYGKELVLDDIYYDFEQSYIREDAMPTLDTLSILLQNNPSINISMGCLLYTSPSPRD